MVVKVALQVGTDAPDTAVHVCAAPRAIEPFINCTVPVGLAPVPVPVTVAVRVTLPPEVIFVDELVTVVVVESFVTAVTVRVGGAGLRSGPPPGCGLKVSTEMVPGVAILLDGT